MQKPNYVKVGQILVCDFGLCSKLTKCNSTSNIHPEIGKQRPVVVVRKFERDRLAIVIPFTTKDANERAKADEYHYNVFIPKGVLVGTFAEKRVLCFM